MSAERTPKRKAEKGLDEALPSDEPRNRGVKHEGGRSTARERPGAISAGLNSFQAQKKSTLPKGELPHLRRNQPLVARKG